MSDAKGVTAGFESLTGVPQPARTTLQSSSTTVEGNFLDLAIQNPSQAVDQLITLSQGSRSDLSQAVSLLQHINENNTELFGVIIEEMEARDSFACRRLTYGFTLFVRSNESQREQSRYADGLHVLYTTGTYERSQAEKLAFAANEESDVPVITVDDVLSFEQDVPYFARAADPTLDRAQKIARILVQELIESRYSRDGDAQQSRAVVLLDKVAQKNIGTAANILFGMIVLDEETTLRVLEEWPKLTQTPVFLRSACESLKYRLGRDAFFKQVYDQLTPSTQIFLSPDKQLDTRRSREERGIQQLQNEIGEISDDQAAFFSQTDKERILAQTDAYLSNIPTNVKAEYQGKIDRIRAITDELLVADDDVRIEELQAETQKNILGLNIESMRSSKEMTLLEIDKALAADRLLDETEQNLERLKLETSQIYTLFDQAKEAYSQSGYELAEIYLSLGTAALGLILQSIEVEIARNTARKFRNMSLNTLDTYNRLNQAAEELQAARIGLLQGTITQKQILSAQRAYDNSVGRITPRLDKSIRDAGWMEIQQYDLGVQVTKFVATTSLMLALFAVAGPIAGALEARAVGYLRLAGGMRAGSMLFAAQSGTATLSGLIVERAAISLAAMEGTRGTEAIWNFASNSLSEEPVTQAAQESLDDFLPDSLQDFGWEYANYFASFTTMRMMGGGVRFAQARNLINKGPLGECAVVFSDVTGMGLGTISGQSLELYFRKRPMPVVTDVGFVGSEQELMITSDWDELWSLTNIVASSIESIPTYLTYRFGGAITHEASARYQQELTQKQALREYEILRGLSLEINFENKSPKEILAAANRAQRILRSLQAVRQRMASSEAPKEMLSDIERLQKAVSTARATYESAVVQQARQAADQKPKGSVFEPSFVLSVFSPLLGRRAARTDWNPLISQLPFENLVNRLLVRSHVRNPSETGTQTHLPFKGTKNGRNFSDIIKDAIYGRKTTPELVEELRSMRKASEDVLETASDDAVANNVFMRERLARALAHLRAGEPSSALFALRRIAENAELDATIAVLGMLTLADIQMGEAQRRVGQQRHTRVRDAVQALTQRIPQQLRGGSVFTETERGVLAESYYDIVCRLMQQRFTTDALRVAKTLTELFPESAASKRLFEEQSPLSKLVVRDPDGGRPRIEVTPTSWERASAAAKTTVANMDFNRRSTFWGAALAGGTLGVGAAYLMGVEVSQFDPTIQWSAIGGTLSVVGARVLQGVRSPETQQAFQTGTTDRTASATRTELSWQGLWTLGTYVFMGGQIPCAELLPDMMTSHVQANGWGSVFGLGTVLTGLETTLIHYAQLYGELRSAYGGDWTKGAAALGQHLADTTIYGSSMRNGWRTDTEKLAALSQALVEPETLLRFGSGFLPDFHATSDPVWAMQESLRMYSEVALGYGLYMTLRPNSHNRLIDRLGKEGAYRLDMSLFPGAVYASYLLGTHFGLSPTDAMWTPAVAILAQLRQHIMNGGEAAQKKIDWASVMVAGAVQLPYTILGKGYRSDIAPVAFSDYFYEHAGMFPWLVSLGIIHGTLLNYKLEPLMTSKVVKYFTWETFGQMVKLNLGWEHWYSYLAQVAIKEGGLGPAVTVSYRESSGSASQFVPFSQRLTELTRIDRSDPEGTMKFQSKTNDLYNAMAQGGRLWPYLNPLVGESVTEMAVPATALRFSATKKDPPFRTLPDRAYWQTTVLRVLMTPPEAGKDVPADVQGLLLAAHDILSRTNPDGRSDVRANLALCLFAASNGPNRVVIQEFFKAHRWVFPLYGINPKDVRPKSWKGLGARQWLGQRLRSSEVTHDGILRNEGSFLGDLDLPFLDRSISVDSSSGSHFFIPLPSGQKVEIRTTPEAPASEGKGSEPQGHEAGVDAVAPQEYIH